MNPEQIATNIIADYQAQTGGLPYAPNLLASLIAAALRAERERAIEGEAFHERQMIATIQALILAIRHPGMYKMFELCADAEQFWREENARLMALRAAPSAATGGVAEE